MHTTIYIYIYIYIYIVIHRLTVLLYHNSSVWLDMKNASSWDWNPPNFMLDSILPLSHSDDIRQLGNYKALCSSFCLFTFCLTGYQSAQHEWQLLIPSPECSTLGAGEHIYCHPQTDCFVVSQLFSVARHEGCFKLELKRSDLKCKCQSIHK